MSHIFISYNHEDNDFAENLIHRLQDVGFKTWRDIDELNAGEVWRAEIDQAIKDAFSMIVIMTPQAKISEYVTYEWAFAFGVGVKVIPVMLKSTSLHPRLEDIQYLDFTTKNRPWDRLIDVVQKVAKLHKPNNKSIPIYIQQAITGLSSLKAIEREEAIENLVQADHPAAREAMVEALEHPLKEIRIQMGLLLAKFQEPKVVPILIDALHSDDNDTRKNAITALTKVGLLAVPDLCRALNDDEKKVRHAAAEALGEIGDTTAVPNLLKTLHDIDEDVRVNAAEALGKLKDHIASPSLLEVLKNTNNGFLFRAKAIIALLNIGNPDAVPSLSECLLNDNDEDIRPFAAYALGEIRNAAALPALITALNDPYGTVRQAAANALGKIRDTSAIPALARTLYDTDPVVVDRTLGALRLMDTFEATEAIENWQRSQREA